LKPFLQVFLLLVLLSSSSFAIDFRDMFEISLKKDEQKKILVKYGKVEKLFKFRWTLYANGGLVIFRSYDKIVAQNVLYLRYKNASFKFDLKPKGADFYEVPYILVKFKEFDYETNKAHFELFISDKKMQIIIENLENS